jgi:hypothetical protein
MLGRSSSELMAGLGSAAVGLVQHQHHPMGGGQQAAAATPAGLPPAVSSHPLRLKTEPSTADHGGLLAAPLPSKASDITAGMNKVRRTHRTHRTTRHDTHRAHDTTLTATVVL